MRHALPLLLVLGLLLLAATPVPAAPGDVAVPDVVGRSEPEASALIKGAGLAVHPVEIAEGEVGRVHSQVPPAGALVPDGETVEIRIGIPLRLSTLAPDAVDRRLEEAVADLSSVYVLEVETVDGPLERAGTVAEQDPLPGTPLLYRGVLRLKVVGGQPGEGAAIVPPVLGQPEATAVQAVEAAGLVAARRYVEDPAAEPGQVVSQDPPSGAQILRGATVTLRIAQGPRDGMPPDAGIVPAVTGLKVGDAQNALLLAGYAVLTDYVTAPGKPAWVVFDQSPPAGTPAPAGSTVKIAAPLPSQKPVQIPTPSVIGLLLADAKAVIADAGLGILVSVVPSGLPQGTAIQQDPAPGTHVPPGAVVKVTVAGAPPGGWQPTLVPVPTLLGLTSDQAFAKLLLSGLWPKKKTHVAPGAPLGVVSQQHPAPGTQVAPGTHVSFYLPLESTVPDLIGRTRTQAVSLLQQAGLNASPQGPAFGLGSTKVVSQSRPPGAKVARGTTIGFAYQWTGGVQPVKVVVPDLIGLSRPQAAQALSAKGLIADFQGPAVGPGKTEVTAQNPGPGTLVPKGTHVLVVYKYVLVAPTKVAVPSLGGMTRPQAQAALQAKGLVPQFQGPAFGLGVTKVTAQNPAPGTLVFPGTTVTVVYVFSGGIQPLLVPVPAVVGMHREAAKQKLAAAGLGASVLGPAFGLGSPHVTDQNPNAGTLVPQGSTVKLKIKWKL